jgi:hypothetical protein
VPARPNRLKARLWVLSLACFAAGFAGRMAANAGVGNVAWSYPIEVFIQWYAYLAGLALWLAWLSLQAEPRRIAPGCLAGVVLAIASFFAIIFSIPK